MSRLVTLYRRSCPIRTRTDLVSLLRSIAQGYVYIWKLSHDGTGPTPLCSFSAHSDYVTRVLLSPDVRHLATCGADHKAHIFGVNLDAPMEETGKPDNYDSDRNFTYSGSSVLRNDRHGAPPSTGRYHGPARWGPNASARAAAVVANLTTNPGNRPYAPESDPRVIPPHVVTGFTRRWLRNRPVEGGPAAAKQPGDPQLEQPAAFPLESTLDEHQRWVWDCAFSADSAYLVTACSDHFSRLWELSSQTIIRQYTGHHRGVVSVALNDTAVA